MAHGFDLNTPEGRYAATQALGHARYNDAMERHLAASIIETVNGYGIRPLQSRFGRLFSVVGTNAAFSTIQAARSHASELEAR